MKAVSLTYALIWNLRQAADWHKAHCGENCNVSLHQLQKAGEELLISANPSVSPDEKNEITDWFREWPL